MEIDLNNPAEFTKESVRQLIASGDDSSHTQLRITKDGKAFLSKKVGADNIVGIAFRLETWIKGNGYVGPEAAKDDEWIERLYEGMKNINQFQNQHT